MKTITLTQGKVALVDDSDYKLVSQFNWHARLPRSNCSWRALRAIYDPSTQETQHEFLQNFLMRPSEGFRIDHQDGDGLNNQRGNLRLCTVQQNSRAFRRKAKGKTSQFRGVFWHKQNSRWRAKIQTNGVQYYLGCFEFEEDAARAYDAAARKYFGEFACPNFK